MGLTSSSIRRASAGVNATDAGAPATGHQPSRTQRHVHAAERSSRAQPSVSAGADSHAGAGGRVVEAGRRDGARHADDFLVDDFVVDDQEVERDTTTTPMAFNFARLLGRDASDASDAFLNTGWRATDGRPAQHLTSWRPIPSSQASAPTPRSGHTAVCDGTYVYVFGGYHYRRCYAELYRLHLATRVWEHMPVRGLVPAETASHSAVLLGHRMYCFGGSGPNFGHMNSDFLLVCDVRTGRWSHARALIGGSPTPDWTDDEDAGGDAGGRHRWQGAAGGTAGGDAAIYDRLWTFNMDAFDDWGLSAPDRADVLATIRDMLGWPPGEADGSVGPQAGAGGAGQHGRAGARVSNNLRRRTRRAIGSDGLDGTGDGQHAERIALNAVTAAAGAPGLGWVHGQTAGVADGVDTSSSGMSTDSDDVDSDIESEVDDSTGMSTDSDSEEDSEEDGPVIVGEGLLHGDVRHVRDASGVAAMAATTHGGQSGERPNARYGQSMVLAGEHLYVFGGTTGSVFYGDMHAYHVPSGVWRAVGRLVELARPTPRYRHESVVVGGRLYVLGGGMPDPDAEADGVYMEHIASFDPETERWERRACKAADGHSLPHSRRSHACVAHGTSIFMFGGTNGQIVFGDLWQLDTRTLEWRLLHGDLPRPRTAFSVGGYLGLAAEDDKNRCNDAYTRWVCVPSLQDLCIDAVARDIGPRMRGPLADVAELKATIPPTLHERLFGCASD